jgi:hypothetical protein
VTKIAKWDVTVTAENKTVTTNGAANRILASKDVLQILMNYGNAEGVMVGTIFKKRGGMTNEAFAMNVSSFIII